MLLGENTMNQTNGTSNNTFRPYSVTRRLGVGRYSHGGAGETSEDKKRGFRACGAIHAPEGKQYNSCQTMQCSPSLEKTWGLVLRCKVLSQVLWHLGFKVRFVRQLLEHYRLESKKVVLSNADTGRLYAADMPNTRLALLQSHILNLNLPATTPYTLCPLSTIPCFMLSASRKDQSAS